MCCYIFCPKNNGRESVSCYMALSKKLYICIKCHVLINDSFLDFSSILTPNKLNSIYRHC